MIIFPHVPKTGGSSFRAALESAYGDRLLLDYNNNTKAPHSERLKVRFALAAKQVSLNRQYDLVYGHFDPATYSGVVGPRAMFLRDPATRTVSHYFYLRERGKLADIGLDDFAAQPRIRDIYKLYTGRRKIERLAFVGLTENYGDSLRLFGAIFGVELEERKIRIGNTTPPTDSLNIVRPFQQSNQAIYDSARRRFDALCREYL